MRILLALVLGSIFVFGIEKIPTANAQSSCVKHNFKNGRMYITNYCRQPVLYRWLTYRGSCRTGCLSSVLTSGGGWAPTASMSGDGYRGSKTCYYSDWQKGRCRMQ